MKKQTLSTLLILISLAIGFYSCSKQQNHSESHSKLNLSELNLTLEGLTIESLPYQLFSYKEPEELTNHLNTTFQDFLAEVDELKRSDERIDHVLFNVSFTDNQAVLKSIYFLDTQKEDVIDILNIGSTSAEINWFEIADLLNGKCKPGWTSQGSCSSASCIATKTKSILESSIQGHGDCVQIEYSRGLLAVQICTRSCE